MVTISLKKYKAITNPKTHKIAKNYLFVYDLLTSRKLRLSANLDDRQASDVKPTPYLRFYDPDDEILNVVLTFDIRCLPSDVARHSQQNNYVTYPLYEQPLPEAEALSDGVEASVWRQDRFKPFSAKTRCGELHDVNKHAAAVRV